MSTNVLRKKDIKRSWCLVDAKDKILGRVATEVVGMLMGKNKPNFVPYLDSGDNVVVINAAKVKVSGKKETTKVYFRHSGYPGGDKKETLAQLRVRRPDQLVVHAVKGMLPKNKLGREMIKKLHVYVAYEHDYQDKFKEVKSDS